MTMRPILHAVGIFGAFWMCLAGAASAQQAVQPTAAAASKLQTALQAASGANKYTLIVFYRDNGEPAKNMYQTAYAWSTAKPDQTTVVAAWPDDPAEQALVQRFGVARAPMPMTVVVAPNGAVTGLFSKTLSNQEIEAAIVPPTMMHCMKALQEQKLVFVCLTHTEQAAIPTGVRGLQQDPHFKDRLAVVPMRLNDPSEAKFYQQMQIDAAKVTGPYAVLIAPPGMLLGHFDEQATAATIAGKIHAAGKCCDDPNCKHNQASQASQTPQATRPAPATR